LSLQPGTRLGVYEITGPIGAGGMGEVYRARDTRLDRDVAIKILPDLFAQDPARLARFDREAKTLASLNHPNIAHIHGVIDHPAALVMELVEGEDLAERLLRGPVPLEDALPIARQIADALEAAHEQGIIHRDLKPANVKLRTDGTVKVLDFGLAKAMDAVSAASAPAIMNSPTFTSPAMTELGMILGTAAYMAPEQARGKTVDRRADIWAFGCVLYEMLTGARPFGGDDASMMLAAVLTRDVDFSALPTTTPRSVLRLLHRCLEKDPRKRLSAIGDARLELDDVFSEPPSASGHAYATPSWHSVTWAAAGALVAGLGLIGVQAMRNDRRDAVPVIRSQIPLGGIALSLLNERAFALNAAGTEIVFSGQSPDKKFALYRRRLDSEEVVSIPGTDSATGPFFSPDGQWLAFNQNARLKKMPAAGGVAIDLADAGGMQGGGFLPDGSILFNPSHGEGLARVNAPGDAQPVTTIDRGKGESGHHWPHVLPGGTHALVTVEVDGKPYSDARIMLLTLEGRTLRPLFEGGTDARYLPSGHIIYWHDFSLWIVPFDLPRLQTTGPAKPVGPDVMISEANGQAHFSIADNGTLIYIAGRDTQQEMGLMLVDRSGNARPALAEQRSFATPALSPDGRQLAVTIAASNDSLWTMALNRTTLTRITYEAENANPVWSPDGGRLVLTRHTGGLSRQMHVMPADGSTTPELLRETSRPEIPQSWTRHGNILAFSRMEIASRDVWVMNMDGDPKPRPFLATRFSERSPRFSPDGRWMTYTSDESGRDEVYVRPFPGPGQKLLVSTGGGVDPRWRGDGRELFYRHDDAVLAVDITFAPSLSSATPHVLFKAPYMNNSDWAGAWEVMPDGKTFLLVRDFSQPRTAVTMVQGWLQGVGR
jgi:eukaryotic-like serine/threonine-protein kinase